MQGMILSMLTVLSKKSAVKGKRELGLKGTCIHKLISLKNRAYIARYHPQGNENWFWEGGRKSILQCVVSQQSSAFYDKIVFFSI